MSIPTSEAIIRFRWVPDSTATPEDVDRTLYALQERGADAAVEEGRDLIAVDDAVLLIVGAMAVAQLANMLVDVVRNYKHGGVIIDASTNPPTIREKQALNQGVIVFIAPDGMQTLIQDTRKSLVDVVLEKLLSLIKK